MDGKEEALHQMDGKEEALRRIAIEADKKTGTLDLSQIEIDELPEKVSTLSHLTELDCSLTNVTSLSPAASLTGLTVLRCRATQVSDLTPLASLADLAELDFSRSQVSDLMPLAGHTGLTALHFWATQVSDLTPLAGLTRLTTIDFSRTQVTDLTPLASITGLTLLRFSNTHVSDLTPLASLADLAELDCSGSQVSDLMPLAGHTGLTALHFWATQVSDLTPLASITSLAELTFSSTEVSDLTPLASITGLTLLRFSNTPVSDLTPLASLADLTELNCSGTRVSDLTPLASLADLAVLDFSFVQVSDLTPLVGLAGLTALRCSGSQVTDLTPLASITSLAELNFSGIEVSDLTPLVGLTDLAVLDFSRSQVSDLTPLANITSLAELNLSGTEVSDLTPLASITSLAELNFSNTEVSDLAPLSGLTHLTRLTFYRTQVSDLSPLESLTDLTLLRFHSTEVSDLTPLASLTHLRRLDFSRTQVSDLSPLKSLTDLTVFDLSLTQVTDLTSLVSHTDLRVLHCSGIEVSDLAPLASLTRLRRLDCSRTQVTDLTPLAGLTRLRGLHCSSVQVSDLTPLAGLTRLTTIDFSRTQVTDLTPLASITGLTLLRFSNTHVSDLTPLAGLTSLVTLNCSITQVSNLTPLAKLSKLQKLVFAYCHLEIVADEFWFKPSLQSVVLNNVHLSGVPHELFVDGAPVQDHLSALRAHLRDEGEDPVELTTSKLMVLGNGRAGKTQICRSLAGEAFDKNIPSTHGIGISSFTVPPRKTEKPHEFTAWDFGGQDIYHGTHSLFASSRAIYMIVWTPEVERVDAHEHEGFISRNFPLPYWLGYVRQFSSGKCPLLIVQSQCDKVEDEISGPPVPVDALEEFSYKKILHHSAAKSRGLPALTDAMFDAAQWLKEKQGRVTIGKGRAKVKQRLEDMRAEDATRATAKRINRTISYERYVALCDEAGNVSAPDQLLTYLNNVGTVFYRKGLFNNQVVLDQSWALDAIYAIFERKSCYPTIQKMKGQFSRQDLANLVWDQAGHKGRDEQSLFISMMEQCGICFQYRQGSDKWNEEPVYIAPDLLPPEKPEIELAQKWDTAAPTEHMIFEYELLPPSLMRSIIAWVGARAGLAADYWRGGLYAYETTTGSRALIEQELEEDSWRGRIILQTQRGQAVELLHRLASMIGERQTELGIKPLEFIIRAPSAPKGEAGEDEADEDNERPDQELSFRQESSSKDEYAISYAWNDNKSDEGKNREGIVDRLCVKAEEDGIKILRDKSQLGLGDEISKFMLRIGRSKTVFIILSDAYLKSPNCMYELYQVWQACRSDKDEFRNRVRVFTLPDAKIWGIKDRINYAVHWKEQYEDLRAVVKQHESLMLGALDTEAYRRMGWFVHHIGDILGAVVDTLQPRNFDDLVKQGFGERPNDGTDSL